MSLYSFIKLTLISVSIITFLHFLIYISCFIFISYCDCFANGEFCHQCNCTTCFNNLSHEEERQRAIKSCLERNPTAFRPKIGKTYVGSEERRHNKGCNCRRSGCLKNYCECYEVMRLTICYISYL